MNFRVRKSRCKFVLELFEDRRVSQYMKGDDRKSCSYEFLDLSPAENVICRSFTCRIMTRKYKKLRLLSHSMICLLYIRQIAVQKAVENGFLFIIWRP